MGFQVSQKERFFVSDDNQVLLGVKSQCGLHFCILQKLSSSPFFTLGKTRTYLDTQLKGKLTESFQSN